MIKIKRGLIFSMIISWVLLGTCLDYAQTTQIPKFKLKNLKGETVTAVKFKGKVLLINFWATWCGPCKKEIPDLIKLKENFEDQGFEIISIAVSSGSPKDIAAFAKEMNINYPILVGDANVVRAFGNISVVPTTFIVDKKGQIQKMFQGALPYKKFVEAIKPYLNNKKGD